MTWQHNIFCLARSTYVNAWYSNTPSQWVMYATRNQLHTWDGIDDDNQNVSCLLYQWCHGGQGGWKWKGNEVCGLLSIVWIHWLKSSGHNREWTWGSPSWSRSQWWWGWGFRIGDWDRNNNINGLHESQMWVCLKGCLEGFVLMGMVLSVCTGLVVCLIQGLQSCWAPTN